MAKLSMEHSTGTTRKLNKHLKKNQKRKVYQEGEVHLVIITIEGVSHNDPENISDVIGVYQFKRDANRVANRIKNRLPIKGLDYDNLEEFNEVEVISRSLNKTISNDDDLFKRE